METGVVSGPATKRWVLAATILGSTMAFLDGTVVGVALPVIQSKLHASLSRVQWVVEAYLLFLSALLLVGGSLGDRFGRRRVFASGTAIFAAASALCGAAPSIGALIAARALQGIGAALLVPGSLALITSCFPPGERGRAIGTWSGATALTTALGPLAGGFLVDAVSWRAIFYLNLPIAAAVIAITLFRVPESRDPSCAPLDVAGAAFAFVSLGSLVFALTEASRREIESPIVLVPFLFGLLAGAAFVLREAAAKHPMLPLELFRSRSFSATNGVTLLLYGSLGSALFFLPFELIQARHYTPTQAGAALLPFIILISILSRGTGKLGERLGPRLPLTAGPLLAAGGLALFLLPTGSGSYGKSVLPPIVLLGLGMALAVPTLTTTVMSSEKEKYAGIVSAFNNAVSRIGSLLAIATIALAASSTKGAFSSPGSPSFRIAMGGAAALALAAAGVAAAFLPSGRNAAASVW